MHQPVLELTYTVQLNFISCALFATYIQLLGKRGIW